MRVGRTQRGTAYATAETPGKPWLAITHGAFCEHSEYMPFVDTIVPHASLLLWDLPGHGQSRDVRPCRRLEGVGAHLAEVMDAAGVERAIHLGHSFGGMAAQRFALS